MANKISIVIAAVDLASKAFKDITGKLRIMDKETIQASKSMGLAMAGAGAAVGALGLAMLKGADRYEQSKIAFETMLGSAEAAQKLLTDLTDFAKRTPFELAGLEQTTKKLLAYGITQEEILADLESLGNIAAGVGMDKLPQLTLAFGQVKAATRLTGMELRQFTEAGVPLLDELAKQMGKPVKAIQKLVTEGAIGFDRVRAAMRSLSGEGGRFANLMEKQAGTLSGKWSNLADTWDIFLRNEGKALLDWGKSLVDGLIDLVQNTLPKVIGAIKGIINWFSEYKIAMVAVVGYLVGTLVPAFVDMGKNILKVVAATGPIGLAVAAISSLVYGLMKLKEAVAEAGEWPLVKEALRLENLANAKLVPGLEDLTGKVINVNREVAASEGAWSASTGAMGNAFDMTRKHTKALVELSNIMLTAVIPAAVGATAAIAGFGGIGVAAQIEAGIVKIRTAMKGLTKPIGGGGGGLKDAIKNDMEGAYEEVANFALKGEERLFAFSQHLQNIMTDTVMAVPEGIAAYQELVDATMAKTEEALDIWEGKWGGFISTMETVQQTMTNIWVSFRQGVGNAVAGAIIEGQSLAAAFKNILKSIAMTVISTLVQMGIERLALALVYGTANLKELTGRMASLSAQTYAGAFAATASIPLVGPAMAPGVASAALTTMLTKSSAAGLAGAGVGASIGALHGGIDSVPKESTYLLDKGERVLSPKQNRDLMDFMGGGGGSVIVQQLNVLPNSSIDEALFDKPVAWWADLVKEKILPAMNALGRRNHTTSLAFDADSA